MNKSEIIKKVLNDMFIHGFINEILVKPDNGKFREDEWKDFLIWD